MYNHEPAGYQCVFCAFAQGGETEYNKRDDIVYDNGRVVAYISPKWWPNNPGNVIIIPHQHIENIYDISSEVLAEIYEVGKKVASVMKETYKCDGISFRQHNEPAGNQEIWHFHLHVLPRWLEDNLYTNHDNSQYVSLEERKPYADKLRGKIIG